MSPSAEDGSRKRRILITGVSGTGKTASIGALCGRGARAVDLDRAEYSRWADLSELPDVAGAPVRPTQDWVWREDAVAALLDGGPLPLYVAGCAPNMRRFLPIFDDVVLLTVDVDTMLARLSRRGPQSYGSVPDERARVVRLKEDVEPLLRGVATVELDTSAPIDETLSALLALSR